MVDSAVYFHNQNSEHNYHFLNMASKYCLARSVSNIGDSWILGHHKLVCADGHVILQQHQQLITALKPHLVVNSPPCCHHLNDDEIQAISVCKQSIDKMQLIIKINSKPQDVVLDLFAGCGSTLIACENTGRKACLVEANPFLVDMIIQSWQLRTGQTAVHESSGWSFNELLSQKKII